MGFIVAVVVCHGLFCATHEDGLWIYYTFTHMQWIYYTFAHMQWIYYTFAHMQIDTVEISP